MLCSASLQTDFCTDPKDKQMTGTRKKPVPKQRCISAPHGTSSMQPCWRLCNSSGALAGKQTWLPTSPSPLRLLLQLLWVKTIVLTFFWASVFITCLFSSNQILLLLHTARQREAQTSERVSSSGMHHQLGCDTKWFTPPSSYSWQMILCAILPCSKQCLEQPEQDYMAVLPQAQGAHRPTAWSITSIMGELLHAHQLTAATTCITAPLTQCCSGAKEITPPVLCFRRHRVPEKTHVTNTFLVANRAFLTTDRVEAHTTITQLVQNTEPNRSWFLLAHTDTKVTSINCTKLHDWLGNRIIFLSYICLMAIFVHLIYSIFPCSKAEHKMPWKEHGILDLQSSPLITTKCGKHQQLLHRDILRIHSLVDQQ